MCVYLSRVFIWWVDSCCGHSFFDFFFSSRLLRWFIVIILSWNRWEGLSSEFLAVAANCRWGGTKYLVSKRQSQVKFVIPVFCWHLKDQLMNFDHFVFRISAFLMEENSYWSIDCLWEYMIFSWLTFKSDGSSSNGNIPLDGLFFFPKRGNSSLQKIEEEAPKWPRITHF